LLVYSLSTTFWIATVSNSLRAGIFKLKWNKKKITPRW
jgi:hypothetical protein